VDPTHDITRILGWVHYWAILAPRLADAGIEAVHVPVIIKNQHPFAGCVPLFNMIWELNIKKANSKHL
jgi:hypothetical protein